jgi:hypothetical protein
MPHCNEQYGQCVAVTFTPMMLLEGYFTGVPPSLNRSHATITIIVGCP